MSCSPISHRVRRLAGGFSLVELIVVMVILGMLAGLVAVQTRGYLISSKQNAAKAEIANIVKALETFYADQDRYPTTDEGIEILVVATDSWPDGFLNNPWTHGRTRTSMSVRDLLNPMK